MKIIKIGDSVRPEDYKTENNLPYDEDLPKISNPCIGFPCFTPEQVKNINKEVKKYIMGEQSPKDAASYTNKIGKFYHVAVNPLMELLHPWLYQCQSINKHIYGYDIDWDFHLDVFNYNIYGLGGEYGYHMDANNESKLDIKLTCLLNLSEEPYEGGKFSTINSADEIVRFDPGEGLVLNSLIAHRVTPVTKGERITLTYFGEGPAWR